MRKYIGKKRTYRIGEDNYNEFKSWCSKRGVDASLAIRSAISLLMEKGNITELLQSSEYKNLAINLLSEEN